jgi:hypothetical protein
MITALAFLLAHAVPTAQACGGFISDSDSAVTSADFRAVYFSLEEETIAVVQAGVTGQSDDFTWLFPIPAPLTHDTIGTVSNDAVEMLIESTDPRFDRDRGCGGPLMIGMYGCASSQSVSENASVGVLQTWETDDYEIVYLDPDEKADVTEWLASQGYNVDPSLEEILDTYTAEGWLFLAVHFTGGIDSEDATAVPAIAFSYASSTPTFPLRIGATSTAEETEVIVFVAGAHRMEPEDDSWVIPDLGGSILGSQQAEYYTARLQTALEEEGQRAWGLEYGEWNGAEYGPMESILYELAAQDLIPSYVDYNISSDDVLHVDVDDYYLARYRTWLGPDDYETDLVFTRAETDEAFDGGWSTGYAGFAFPGIWLFLATAGACVRRRRER